MHLVLQYRLVSFGSRTEALEEAAKGRPNDGVEDASKFVDGLRADDGIMERNAPALKLGRCGMRQEEQVLTAIVILTDGGRGIFQVSSSM